MTAGMAMLMNQSKVLAEKAIMLYEVLMLSISNHLSKTMIQTEPLTAISIMVMKGTTIMARYVIDTGIIMLKYDRGMLKAHDNNTNCEQYNMYRETDKINITDNSLGM